MRYIVFSADECTFALISLQTMYVCDFETGYCISGPFELPDYIHNACFSPDGNHILLQFCSYAVVWNIEMHEE